MCLRFDSKCLRPRRNPGWPRLEPRRPRLEVPTTST